MLLRHVLAVLVLPFTALACGFSVSLPEAPAVGTEVTEKVNVAVPAGGSPVRLGIGFGAGELNLSPGGSGLVSGTATYNVPDLKPKVVSDGGGIIIKQGDLNSLPNPSGVKNIWDLHLGAAPIDLTINAGAYQGHFELGGLALTGLTVKDGAASVDLAFSKPNLSEMTVLRYETGASQVKLTGLSNANFDTLVFTSGAGDYTLDFSGTLQRPATATISSGLSNLILVIPATLSAAVTVESGAANISAGPGWTQNGNLYTQSGSGPALTVIVKTGAGNLTLTH